MLDQQRAPVKTQGMTTDPQPSFEQALKELEDIVRKLESGELSLDESISLYERGQTLKAECEARLANAKARIEQIQQGSGGDVSTRPFDAA
jgi:exodeoxyribonuclease VII small subunit